MAAAQQLVREAHATLRGWGEAAFIAGPRSARPPRRRRWRSATTTSSRTLWVNFSEADYEDRIERYIHRLEINDLADGFLAGRRVMDFGCGHGNFLHACLRDGAASGLGIDYGEESIRYSIAARVRLGVRPSGSISASRRSTTAASPTTPSTSPSRTASSTTSTTRTRAYREVHRVLRPGGWIWTYTDGAGAVEPRPVGRGGARAARHPVRRRARGARLPRSRDEQALPPRRRAQRGLPPHDLEDFLARLESYGFGEPRRLVGGFPTDFDHDAIEADPCGRGEVRQRRHPSARAEESRRCAGSRATSAPAPLDGARVERALRADAPPRARRRRPPGVRHAGRPARQAAAHAADDHRPRPALEPAVARRRPLARLQRRALQLRRGARAARGARASRFRTTSDTEVLLRGARATAAPARSTAARGCGRSRPTTRRDGDADALRATASARSRSTCCATATAARTSARRRSSSSRCAGRTPPVNVAPPAALPRQRLQVALQAAATRSSRASRSCRRARRSTIGARRRAAPRRLLAAAGRAPERRACATRRPSPARASG